MTPVSAPTVAFAAALLALVAAGPAAAQAAAASYRVGEKVEVRPDPARDVWEPGLVTDFAYDIGLPIVRSASNERAFDEKDIRHLPPPISTAPASAAPDPPREDATRKKTLVGMTNATPPDDGPVAATPRR